MIEKQKNWFFALLNQYKKPLLIILIGVVILISFIVVTSSDKSYVDGIIRDLVEQQVEIIEQNYEDSLKVGDVQIQELQERLAISEQRYNSLRKEIRSVEKRIVERKPPATTSELRDRFNQLGYSPVN